MKIRFPVPREGESVELSADEVARLDAPARSTPEEILAKIQRKAETHAVVFAEVLAERR